MSFASLVHRLTFAALPVAASLFAVTSASAASLDPMRITGIAATWADPVFTTKLPGPGVGVREIDADSRTISWGRPARGGSAPSSYVFDPIAVPYDVTESPFTLGVFTHNNFVITGNSHVLDTAALDVTISGSIGSRDFSFAPRFRFRHNETPNELRPCDGAAPRNGLCPDIVTFVENDASETREITLDGVTYSIRLEGFIDVLGGAMSREFITTERRSNSAFLRASVTATQDPAAPPPPDDFPDSETPPPVIPLPAAGVLFLAGLGGLGFVARRRTA